MGRPPLGERAMTAAEKQRRYRAKKLGNSASVTNPPADYQRLQARIRELEARIRSLETKQAKQRAASK